MKKVVVKLENVSKSYVDNKFVIKDLSLEVYSGEFLTFLGSSGCGKTTTLRMISGLEHVTDGKIYINNEDVTEVEASKRPVNTIFQNFALFPNMTVEKNIGYGLKMKKIPKEKIKKRVKEMLELVKLEGYEDRLPSQLSGGEQQRVAIARGLINQPEVLLLDEPLSSLDLKLKKQMQIELKNLQKKLKITFIYVTHAQDEALKMSDRIIVFKDGKIIQEGTPEEIYNHPNSIFVADFIGDSSILEGKVIEKNKTFATIYLDEKTIIKTLIEDMELPNDINENDKVNIITRPEKIKVHLEKKENYLEVKVKELIYNGSFKRLNAIYNDKEIKINIDIDDRHNYEKDETIYLELDKDIVVLKKVEHER